MKELQKQNIKKNACKTSKAERRQKLNKFQDKMHSLFGTAKVTFQRYDCFECVFNPKWCEDSPCKCISCTNGNQFEQKETK